MELYCYSEYNRHVSSFVYYIKMYLYLKIKYFLFWKHLDFESQTRLFHNFFLGTFI